MSFIRSPNLCYTTSYACTPSSALAVQRQIPTAQIVISYRKRNRRGAAARDVSQTPRCMFRRNGEALPSALLILIRHAVRSVCVFGFRDRDGVHENQEERNKSRDAICWYSVACELRFRNRISIIPSDVVYKSIAR
ncbi:hypothetical protein Trydic_g21121 [Trypoxylus dichotomus]